MTLSSHWPSALGLPWGTWPTEPWATHGAAILSPFGAAASWLEARCYADRQAAGVLHTGRLVGAAIALGAALERLISNRPLPAVMTTAAATWAVLGGRSLSRRPPQLPTAAGGSLSAARDQVRHLVGRDTAELSTEEVARATVESVAENASDAVVAPLLWGAVAGLPGLLGYRAVNTLDAMIGHRSPRYLSSDGRPPGWTTWPTGCRRDLPRWQQQLGRRWSAASPESAEGGTPRRRPTSQPECWRRRGCVRRRARRPARRRKRVPRHCRGSRHPGHGRPVAVADINRATASRRRCR